MAVDPIEVLKKYRGLDPEWYKSPDLMRAFKEEIGVREHRGRTNERSRTTENGGPIAEFQESELSWLGGQRPVESVREKFRDRLAAIHTALSQKTPWAERPGFRTSFGGKKTTTVVKLHARATIGGQEASFIDVRLYGNEKKLTIKLHLPPEGIDDSPGTSRLSVQFAVGPGIALSLSDRERSLEFEFHEGSIRVNDALLELLVASAQPPSDYTKEPGPALPVLLGGDDAGVDHHVGPDRSDPIVVARSVLLQLLTALHTRPLVLLAGISGSGKTQLARSIGQARAEGWIQGATAMEQLVGLARKGLIAPATGTAVDAKDGWWDRLSSVERLQVYRIRNPGHPARFDITSVQSDWMEASSLWGYFDRVGEKKCFEGTKILRVFLDGWGKEHTGGNKNDRRCSHTVVLDEMNLSRPEHYASDLLSAMELIEGKALAEGAAGTHAASGDVSGNRTEPAIRLHRLHGQTVVLAGAGGTQVPAAIGWPRGLVVIGTVNVDETTFSFAPKVLDRAAILEFTEVWPESIDGYDQLSPQVRAWFAAVQRATTAQSLHLGYRAIKEIMKVLGFRDEKRDSKAERDILDQQLRDKVLPRIRGPKGKVEKVLLDLLALALQPPEHEELIDPPAKAITGRAELSTNAATWRSASVPSGHASEIRDTRTAAAKAWQMLQRLKDVGFTGYF